MIWPAFAAGGCCLTLIAVDLRRYPANALAMMRSTLAALWGAGWLAYGLNFAQFPAPRFETWIYLAVTCAISIAMVPSPGTLTATRAPALCTSSAWRWYFHVILGISTAVVLWDLWHVIEQSTSVGLQQAIVTHRANRTLKAGGYSLPGMEVAHSVAAVTGVLGYAVWLSQRRAAGAIAAAVGLTSMLTSTGRWDVVAFGLWCLVLEAMFAAHASSRQFLASSLRLFALLAVFFVVHGELLSKVGALQSVAEVPGNMRATSLNTAESLGYHGTGPPPMDVWAPQRRCDEWTDGAERANRAFLRMSRLTRVFTLYFAGPFAAFDRSVCERRRAVREVILYWPNKISRLLHLTATRGYFTVDPFIDIGIPYNNYTLFHPFLDKFGGAGGILAWLSTALALRLFMRKMFAGAAGLHGVVAGIAPFAIAVRGLWTNAFFDGSMIVYVLVALGGYAMSQFEPGMSAPVGVRRHTNLHLPS